ncbi:MAG: hypothetical protein ACI9G1_001793, partial [Pirellulaceae bacterium]
DGRLQIPANQTVVIAVNCYSIPTRWVLSLLVAVTGMALT